MKVIKIIRKIYLSVSIVGLSAFPAMGAQATLLGNLSLLQNDAKFKQTNATPKPEKKKKKGKVVRKTNQSKSVPVPLSVWGATGIAVSVEEKNVSIKYDCADGEINQKLMIDENGNFKAEGVHIRRAPGPIRVGFPPQRQYARYEGRISGETMTLKVTLTESEKTIGEYTLTRNVEPRLRRCY